MAMARRWRGTDDEQTIMATASEHGRKGEGAERLRKLTLDAWVCSATTGRAGDGDNRRWRAVDAGEIILRFRREGGFPASERRQGGRVGPGEAAGGGDASMAAWSGGKPWRRHG